MITLDCTCRKEINPQLPGAIGPTPVPPDENSNLVGPVLITAVICTLYVGFPLTTLSPTVQMHRILPRWNKASSEICGPEPTRRCTQPWFDQASHLYPGLAFISKVLLHLHKAKSVESLCYVWVLHRNTTLQCLFRAECCLVSRAPEVASSGPELVMAANVPVMEFAQMEDTAYCLGFFATPSITAWLWTAKCGHLFDEKYRS